MSSFTLFAMPRGNVAALGIQATTGLERKLLRPPGVDCACWATAKGPNVLSQVN